MSTYKDSGVDIEMGDECSAIAYQAAKNTFPSRKNMIGEPVLDDGGFAGLMDMGDFYLVQNDDGIGTKMIIAEKAGLYDTMGYDLLAMVCDDAICIGAETISISNTLDVDKVDPAKIKPLISGLEKACLEHKIVIPGGEIAELGEMVNGYVWNATSVGVVSKEKLIDGSKVQPGDALIGLKSDGLRSNGLSLVRHILEQNFGPDYHSEPYNENTTWGQKALTPSKIYSSAILEMIGRHGQPAQIEIKAIAHITGGGLPGNLPRALKRSGLSYEITNPIQTPELFQKLMDLGSVAPEEAAKTWNMGTGMVLISNEFEAIQKICASHGIEAQIIGEVV